MPPACGTITVLMEKGQERLSAVRGSLSSPYATLASRMVLGGVFLVAGATKIPAPGALAAAIRSYELPLPEWFVSLSAHALPYLEVLLGLYLLAGLFTKISAWATNGLVLLFLLALLQGVVRGLEIDCGCFGSSAGETSNLWLAAARDLQRGQLFAQQYHPEYTRHHGLYGGDDGGPPGAEVPDPERVQGEGERRMDHREHQQERVR